MTDDIQQQEVGSGGSAGQTGGAVNSPASTGADGSAALALQEQAQTATSAESASESGNTTDSANTHGGSAEAEADESEANPESEPTDSDSVDDAAEEILEEGASRSNSYLSGLKGVTIPNTTPFYSDKVQRGRHFSDKTAIRADDPNLDDGMKKIFAMLDENASAYYEKQDAQKPKLFPESSYEAKPEETLPSDSSLAELAQQSARINSRDDVQIEASLGLKPGDLENFDDFDDFDDERKKTYATLTGTLAPISAPILSESQKLARTAVMQAKPAMSTRTVMPTRAVMQTLAMLPIMQLLPVLPTQLVQLVRLLRLVQLKVRLNPLPLTPAPQQVMPAMPTRLRLPRARLPSQPGNKPINPPPNLGKRARASMLHKLSQPRHQRKPHNNRSTHPSPLLPTNRTP